MTSLLLWIACMVASVAAQGGSGQAWDSQMMNTTQGGMTYVQQAPQALQSVASDDNVMYMSRDPCRADCGDYFDPVCASNGHTYWNMCTLGVASCRNPSVYVVRRGHCMSHGGRRGDGGCHRYCETSPYHVCASNGQTYHNRCFFNRAKCYNPSIYISYIGWCYHGNESPWRGSIAPSGSRGVHGVELLNLVDDDEEGPVLGVHDQ